MSTANAIDKMINTMSKEDIVKWCADSKMELMKIHASEMKEVLENILQLSGCGHFGSSSGQIAFSVAQGLLDKYRHLLGDGK